MTEAQALHLVTLSRIPWTRIKAGRGRKWIRALRADAAHKGNTELVEKIDHFMKK